MAITINLVLKRFWKSEKLFLIPLSVYGLGVYAHFLWHATINFYYMVPLPLVGCICFWGTQILEGMAPTRQRLVKLVLGSVAVIALFTNFLFTYYPNVFNLAGENWEQEKESYRAVYNSDHDADFIRHWTLSSQRVALISGFATPILLQADRASFFYGGLPMMSGEDIKELLNQLDKDKPQQVFIDKRIFSSPSIVSLTDYLKAHYRYNGQQSDNLILLRL